MKNFGRKCLFAVAISSMLASPALSQDPSPIKLPSTLRPKTSVKALKQPKKRFETVRTKALEKAKKRASDKKKKAAPAKKPASKPFKKLPAPKVAKPAKKTEKPVAKAPTTTKVDPKDKKVPSWRKVDEEDDEKETTPTLSADFIKNCAKLEPGVKVTLDIYDEELEAVVKLIACMTGKNIILAKPLKGKKITIYSPTMVTADEAYRAFLTALETNGFTISRQGKFLRIIPIKDFARASDPLLREGVTPPNQDRMVTQIIPLKYVDAGEINEVLSKLASANAQFIVYQPSNSLIVTEIASNLRKLRSLIAQLDVPGGKEELWIYQVLHAEASDIASKITEVFEKDQKGKSGKKRSRISKARGKKRAATSTSVGESDLDVRVSKVISDERTNRLLIVANRRSYRRVKKLIARLDIPVEGDGQVHIHQLNHAKANDLASVLSSLSSNQNRRTKRKKRKKKRKKSSAQGSSAALFEGEVSVTADEDTNALVITASLKDYLSLKRVIDALDRPRRQVFIEAVLMEVSITNNRKHGITSHFAYDPTFGGEKGLALFGNNPPDGGGSVLDLASASTLTGLAVQGPPIEVGGVSLPSFGAILRALATNSDINVLSTPHILTTDNEEAEIVVGDNVPFASGFVGGMGGLGQLGGAAGAAGLGGLLPTVNVQRQDVALTLKITPRINAANFVTLEIDQVVEELGDSLPGLGPKTSKRKIKSTVVVKDQNTVVIGGLQKSKQLNKKGAVPILGEIPVIGYFFRGSENNRERVNLLLMLTPHVIEGPQDFQAIMKRKLEEHQEFVERFHQKGEQLVLSLDYRKKHGVLEAINQSIIQVRADQRILDELREQEKGPPLPQDLDCLGEDEDDGRKCDVPSDNTEGPNP